MTPIVNGKWYPTAAEGYADSPFFKGEVTHCVHGKQLGQCAECRRYIDAYEAEQREWRARRDAWDARPWWRRFLSAPPAR